MKMKLAAVLGTVGTLLAVSSVQAIPISTYMGGDDTVNSSGTAVTSWPLVYVVADSGSFALISPYTFVNPEYSTADIKWNLAAEAGGTGDFTFSASTGASDEGDTGSGSDGQVPDGGLTLAFLGVALAGVEVFRRKLNKA